MNIPKGDNSKYWILPDGKIENLGKLWHFQWILQNLTKLKKYKVKQSEIGDDLSEGPVRLYAINKGFVRMNYSINGGTLTIEAPDKNWTRSIRNAIYDFIQNNVNRIDQLYIAILDEKGRPKRRANQTWFRSTADEKLLTIPFITENHQD